MSEPESTASTRRRVPAWLWAYCTGMDAELSTIRQYVETVISSFQQDFKECEAHLSKLAQNAVEDERQWIGEHWDEQRGLLLGDFPAFALHTSFVATYSLLEHMLVTLVKGICDIQELEPRFDELAGSDTVIDKVKDYLKTNCGIAFPEGKHQWQEIQHYNRIRNAIVHRRGRISRSTDENAKPSKEERALRDYINARKLTIDPHGRFWLTEKFFLDALDDIQTFWNDLYRVLLQRYA